MFCPPVTRTQAQEGSPSPRPLAPGPRPAVSLQPLDLVQTQAQAISTSSCPFNTGSSPPAPTPLGVLADFPPQNYWGLPELRQNSSQLRWPLLSDVATWLPLRPEMVGRVPVSHLVWLKAAACAPAHWTPAPSPRPLLLTLLLEDAPLDEFERQKDSTLLLQRGGVGGHGAWCDAPNVRVMPAASHIEHRPCLTWPKHLGVKSNSQHCGCPARVPGALALTGVMTVRSGR